MQETSNSNQNELTQKAQDVSDMQNKIGESCANTVGLALRHGEPCPYCLIGRVEYDSLLNLVCQNCGKTQTGAFT